MVSLSLVPAKAIHFEEVYGHPAPRSIKGMAGLVNGKAVAIAGVYYFPDTVVAFCNVRPEAQQYKIGLARGALKVLEMIKGLNIPVYAVAEASNPAAEDFLMRCGFTYCRKEPAGEVFICKP